jgi:hypothetical protein
MLDETGVRTILARYFPLARPADISEAARDVVLLDLLADDRIPVWEDSLRDRAEPGCVQVFAPGRRFES